MLYYLPLEPYVERYTWFMSCKDGWAEDNFKKSGVDFIRVEGKCLDNRINVGKVLDAYGRSYYATTQTAELIALMTHRGISESDVVYVEDFWHPGIESLFYIRHLTGINFKIGTFLHAQSVDDTDFSYDMREWMRPIEIGYGKGFDYIFVTSAILKELCVKAGIGDADKIHNVGLPYNSNKLIQQLHSLGYKSHKKENYVIFSSRFDDEKDPMFFLDLVERCKDIKFVLVKPRKFLTTNKEVVDRVERLLATQDNFSVVDTSNKLAYYEALSAAKVQFNCALQDWVSWTLLEAITFGCLPLYPKWKDFPHELKNEERYLYNQKDLYDAELKLRNLMAADYRAHEDPLLTAVTYKHNNSWAKYLEIMGVTDV